MENISCCSIICLAGDLVVKAARQDKCGFFMPATTAQLLMLHISGSALQELRDTDTGLYRER